MKGAWRILLAIALLAPVVTATAIIRTKGKAPESVRKQVEVSMLLTGTIDIDPDGSVSGYVLDDRAKVPGYVSAFLDDRVPAWQFQPTTRNGQAVAVRSPMSLRMVARPVDGGNFQMSIAGVSFGKYSDSATDQVTRDRMQPPSYPAGAASMGGKGTVYLVLRINRAGRVEDLFVEQVNLTAIGTEEEMAQMRERFGQAATKAAWKWTFHPPTTGDAVDEAHWAVRVPVAFMLYDTAGPRYGTWQAYLPGPRATASWAQDDAKPDAIAGVGLHPVGGGPKLLTPLQEG